MLRHVVDAADNAAFYMNRHSHKNGIRVSYAVLCPDGDPIKRKYGTRCPIIEGSEDDVLGRYVSFGDRLNLDFVVRVTGDCPLLPSYLISSLINDCIRGGHDYCSNVDESCRTAIDGYDVEVFSRAALAWANENAKEPRDREHVTTIMRTKAFADKFSYSVVLGHLDLSHLKYSVDTMEDLERVRAAKERIKMALQVATAKCEKKNVHRI